MRIAKIKLKILYQFSCLKHHIHTPQSPLDRGDFKPPLYQEGPGVCFNTCFQKEMRMITKATLGLKVCMGILKSEYSKMKLLLLD